MKKIYANNLTTLSLGRQGENLARQVVFDIRDLESLYGSGTVEVIHQRPGDAQPYPLAVQRDGTLVTWDVTATDTEMSAATANERYGKCELRYYAGETLAKSQIWRTWVESAMDTPSETAPPEPEQGWVDKVLEAGTSAKEAADRAAAAQTKAPKIQNGTWWVFDASSQAYVDTGVKAQGERGIQGERGETGAPGQQGEKGDPFRYEDFTPEQLDDLERGAKAAQAAAETAAASAATSAGQASVSEQNAAGSASAAKASEDAAKASETAAANSEKSAQDSAASASASATAASDSAAAAAESETSAIEAKTAAETAKTEAGKSASAAKASEDATRESETASAESASAASASAGAAKVSETAAKASESAAAGSASQAAGSASSASGSAEGAANSANAASEYERAAEAAKNAAQASETAAKTSETAAQASETAAKSAETASKQSETAAAGSASAAQQSASAAAESATSAAESAASIGDAEQIVTQKAEEASTSAANAAASAEAAARSAEQAAEVVGGNFATKAEAQGYANTAESNAKAYADQQIAAIPTPDVSGQIGSHNTNTEAHNDIRELITGLTNRLNALADSDDTTLDQLSEVVAYIKSNRSLIESITTSKVNVADIINNLTTNVSNKPLSAAQGVALKALIDAITVPTKVSELENDSGYLTSYTETDPTVPAWAKAQSKPTYTASEVGLGNVGNFKAVSTVASQGLTNTEKSNARANIGAGTSSLTIGTTASTAAAGNHTHTAANVGAVPTSRTVNGKALSDNITLAASDVGAYSTSETDTLLQNKANSNHSHAAENITSGTLAVARGGTGKSSVTSGNFLVGNGTGAMTEKTPAQVLSAIGAAASGHNHDDKYYTEAEVNQLLQNYLPLSGGTLTGNLTGKYLTGTWLQVTEDNHLSTASTKIAVIDSSGWVYYRTIAELLADLGIPDATSIRATTSVYGTTKLSTSVTSTSKTLAATPYSVKMALDQAKAYTNSAIGDAIAASY